MNCILSNNIHMLRTYQNLIIILVCISFSYKGKSMHIEEPTLSIDRISFLVNSPRLACDGKNRTLKETGELVSQIILNYPDHLETKCLKDLGATDNYFHHFRLKGGFDLQFGAKNKLRKKIGEADLIGFHIPKELTISQFLLLANHAHDNNEPFKHNSKTVNLYSGESSEYGIRIEFNPNNVVNYDSLAWFCNTIVKEVNPFCNLCAQENTLFKITRIDLAVDYPEVLNPLMFTSRANKMSFYVSQKHGVETVYFGTSRSKKQVRLYNKRVEMIEQGQGYCDNDDLWRFEMAFSESFFIDDLSTSDSPIFKNPFLNFDYYDFDSIVKLKDLNFDVRCCLYAANTGLGIQTIIAEHAATFDNKKSRDNWVRRFKQKLKGYSSDSFGSIAPPKTIYDAQFITCWEVLKSDIKGCFS